MDESFFLYWEEVDWAIRAKAECGVGYAHKSVVPHVMGTTTGSAGGRAKRSAFSVYLGHRNQLHFVRRHHPRWFCGPCSSRSSEAGNIWWSGRREISSRRFRV